MNKIINWVGGSFFRTIGRILVYILIGYILSILLTESNIKLPSIFNILQVEALQIGGTEFSTPSEFQLYNNISLTSSSGITTTKGTFTGTGIVYGYGTVSTTTSGYGASWCMNTNITFLNNYIYSIQIAVLNENNIPFNIVSNDSYDMLRLGYSLQNASTHQNSTSILYFGAYTDNHGAYVNGNQFVGKVYVLNYLFTSKLNSQYVCLPFKHTQNTTNQVEYFYGYKIDIIGQNDLVTNSSLNSAIQNSGLATASSVSQVQSSISQVQQEIQGTQNAIEEQTQQQQENHEETINTITDDSINENGVSDFTSGLNKEYSSLTPFSDFLNLPLTWIQSLFASGQNCTAIHLPLPYLNNKYLDLPCMTEFWQRMGAIGTLIQVVWIAIVGVRIFNGLFLLTCETIDPNPDRDMTKLRTWEL